MDEGNLHLLLAAVAVVGLYLLMRRLSSAHTVDAPRERDRARTQIPRLGAAHRARTGVSEDLNGSANLDDAPSELTRWQVAMHELARDLKGEIDTKLAALQTLVAMARQEADRLQKLLEQASRASPPPPHGQPSPAQPAAKADSPSEAQDPTFPPRDALARLAQLADPAMLADAAQTVPRPAAGDPLADNARDMAIARLAQQGHAPEAIAQQLGLPLGEVELRLSLRPRGD